MNRYLPGIEVPKGGATLSLRDHNPGKDLIDTIGPESGQCQVMEMQEIVTYAGNWDRFFAIHNKSPLK
jgi:hypothetical protein